MGVGVLGPVEVDGAAPLEPRDRMALGVLVVRNGETVTPDQFADALWADEPPSSWSKQVQICVGRLRKVLGPDAIVTTAGGYRLSLDDDELDVCRFERLVERARELTAVGEHDRAAATYRRALGLWRGPPLDELDGWSPGQSEVARLQELRRAAEEEWVAARLDAGEQREVAALAEGLVNEEPLRERRWAILALAQYRCARQVDALRSIARARRVLGELGIDPGSELVELEGAILRQDPALAAIPEMAAASAVCPYKGLAPYDEDDTDAFFGRDAEILACVERLRATPLLVVAGPSGCGKSSLVRAGVVPSLRRHGTEVAVFTPGGDPIAALAAAATSGDDAAWVVDQFEELFTLTQAPDVQRIFCATLAARARRHVPVIIVIRSDHLGGFSIDGDIGELVERGLHLVSTLSGDSLREAIEQPARMAGLRLEHGLVDLLVRDCEGEPGALPLLSHALAETWRRRDGTTLTVEGYESSGGIRVAVARSADRLYDSLPADQRDALRSILLRLVTPTLDGDPVRCRVASRSILGDPSRDRVVGLLVRARLVTTERDTFEIAHEALARAWPRLRAWLDDDVAGQRVLRHLVSAADGWDSLGRPDTELYRGARLETALEWRAQASTPDLTDIEAAFLDASVDFAESEQRSLAAAAERESRSNRRLRRMIGALAVLLAVSLVAGAIALRSSRQAERARQVASARGLAAAASSNIPLDPERAVLLGIEAVELSRPLGGDVLQQAEEALHGALAANQLVWRAPETGGAVDWSPDGTHVATEGPEGTGRVDIRAAASGEIVRTFDGPGLDVTDVEYSPDGSVLAVTDRSGTARLLDPVTGDELSRLEGPDVLARAPSFSPDGSMLAVVWPREDRVRIVDVATGAEVLDSRVAGANGASWSPDGSRLAVASESEPVGVVLEVASGNTVATLEGHFGVVFDAEWSPDGRSIATAGDDGSARVFAADTGLQTIAIPGHGATVDQVSWNPDSTTLASSSADGTVRVWSVLEGGPRALMTLTGDDVRSGGGDVEYSPDGTALVASGRSGVTALWDVGLSAGSEVATLPAASFFFTTAEFGADGEHLYATGGGGRVGTWDASTWEPVAAVGTAGGSPPGPTGIFDIPLGGPDDFMRIAPSPDGDLVAAVPGASVAGESGRVRVFDTDTGDGVFDVSVGSQAIDADWSPDGEVLAIAGRNADDAAIVRIVDRDGTTQHELTFGDVIVGVAGFNPDGDSLVVWIEPPRGLYVPDVGRVEVWDWRNETLLRTLDTDPYYAVMSPVDDIVAVGPYDSAPDQTMSVWNTRTGERIETLEGHSGAPNHMAFTADGTRLAVAGTDGTTRVWNPSTGDLQLTLGGHLGLVSSVSFSPDGTQLATAAVDGRVRIWALDVDTLLEIARQRVTRTLTDDECRRYLGQPRCETN